ncbi:putative membrane protein [Ogataea parapolymorpha DL-1]|uniref:Membrane protein n=1 Tax=Ogataea parapolymorpha (strain ATCC 26012 / BCRC 20466 / JCM 22074 / NRRL Y-7560 / DL-1) TaxID=871575 RepID=W1QDB8_OGAPD|nr:putative membrane protein [Ogataea parapolymorpha DL-1]ESW98585.1 putative membrane protein [Ogataea parapolymorpha DL-1]
MNYILLGVLLSVSGNILISISLNIQKQAHLHLGSEHYARNLKWQLGFVLMSLGEVGNFVSYGLTPVSIVAPLGVVTIISNSTFIAPVLFHEKIRRRDLYGTFSSAIGVVFMILSSVTDSAAPPIQDPFSYIDSMVLSLPTLIYLATTLFTIVVLMFRLRNLERSMTYILLHLSLVALFGTYTAISTKLLSSVVEFVPFSDIFVNWRPYVLFLVIIGTSGFQVHYLNSCLKIANATTVVPIHFVFFTTAVLLCSIVVFNDFADKSAAQCIVFLVGALLTFSGVFLICGAKTSENENDLVWPEPPTYIPAHQPVSETASVVSIDEELPPRPQGLIQTSKSTPELNNFIESEHFYNATNRRNSLLDINRPPRDTKHQGLRDLGHGYFVLGGGSALMNAILKDHSQTPETRSLA